MRRKLLVGGAAALLAAGAGTGAAVAVGDDGDATVTGPRADRAAAAALVETRGGTVNAVERDDEDGAAWEVEVTRPDGTTVDVRLDERLRVVVVERDGEEEESGPDD